MKCKGKSKNGKRCNTNAMKNGFCYFHNPDITEKEKKEAVTRGGKTNKIIVVNEPYEFQRLENVTDVAGFLGRLINDTLAGKLDLRIATGLTYISNSLLKALELSQLNDKVDNIETMINELKLKKNL